MTAFLLQVGIAVRWKIAMVNLQTCVHSRVCHNFMRKPSNVVWSVSQLIWQSLLQKLKLLADSVIKPAAWLYFVQSGNRVSWVQLVNAAFGFYTRITSRDWILVGDNIG